MQKKRDEYYNAILSPATFMLAIFRPSLPHLAPILPLSLYLSCVIPAPHLRHMFAIYFPYSCHIIAISGPYHSHMPPIYLLYTCHIPPISFHYTYAIAIIDTHANKWPKWPFRPRWPKRPPHLETASYPPYICIDKRVSQFQQTIF